MKMNEKLTERLVQAIEADPNMTWRSMYDKAPSLINGNTGKHYQGGNRILLTLQLWALGYESGIFLTFKQAQAKGLKMIKGSKGCYVSFFSPIYKDKDGKTVKTKEEAVSVIPCSRWYTVFSLDCFEESEEKSELINSLGGTRYDNLSLSDIDEDIDKYLEQCGIELKHSESCTPCYSPASDRIMMPYLNQFRTSGEFYKTFFHEIAHSTGHESRLNRDFSRDKRSYGNEELIAELSACQLANAYGLNRSLDTSASYLATWIRTIKEEPQVLFSSASHADKVLAFYSDCLEAKKSEVA
jgi:antirestriction protein ArdC